MVLELSRTYYHRLFLPLLPFWWIWTGAVCQIVLSFILYKRLRAELPVTRLHSKNQCSAYILLICIFKYSRTVLLHWMNCNEGCMKNVYFWQSVCLWSDSVFVCQFYSVTLLYTTCMITRCVWCVTYILLIVYLQHQFVLASVN